MKNKAKCCWMLVAIALLQGACTPPRFPLEITDLTVEPEPVVGQVVTLRVEVMSTHDEPDTTIAVQLPEGVKLVEGNLLWQGSLNMASHITKWFAR